MGMLVPAPAGRKGEARWYRVDRVAVGKGRLYYVLKPAHEEYSINMPNIVMFRDTTTSPGAVDAGSTLIRDLYPNALPGYLWGDSTKTIDEEVIAEMLDDKEKILDSSQMRNYAILGNSLGGRDAMSFLLSAIEHAIVQKKLPKQSLVLFTHSAVGLHDYDVKKFKKYVKAIEPELKEKNIHLSIEHWAEDIDPVSGVITCRKRKERSYHLGYGLEESSVVIKNKAIEFTKTKQPKAKEVKKLGLHMRRFGTASIDADYVKQSKTVEAFNTGKAEPLAFRVFRSTPIYNLVLAVYMAWRKVVGRNFDHLYNSDGVIHGKFSSKTAEQLA